MRKSIAFLIVGVILLLIGLGLSLSGLFLMGVSPEEYDKWVTDSSRMEGDELTVTGTIADKDGGELFGFGFYKYRFEGSEEPFYSAEDFANEGDYVTVNIEIFEGNIPQVRSTSNFQICLIPGVICVIISIILLSLGVITRRKEPKPQTRQYPPSGYYNQPQQPQPQYQQPQMYQSQPIQPQQPNQPYQPYQRQQPQNYNQQYYQVSQPNQPQQYPPYQQTPPGQPPRQQY